MIRPQDVEGRLDFEQRHLPVPRTKRQPKPLEARDYEAPAEDGIPGEAVHNALSRTFSLASSF